MLGPRLLFRVPGWNISWAFEALMGAIVEENRRKSGVFCFESEYLKRITAALSLSLLLFSYYLQSP